MKTVFGDSSYFFALINQRDADHALAAHHFENSEDRILTTGWVAMEVADGFCKPKHRTVALQLIDQFRTDPGFVYIPCTEELMLSGLELFRARPDKAWSLTDCISFVVMEQHKLTEALTADHHFEQAGFVALMRPTAS